MEAEVVDEKEHKSSSKPSRKDVLKERFSVDQLEKEISRLYHGYHKLGVVALVLSIVATICLVGAIVSVIFLRDANAGIIVLFVFSHVFFWTTLALAISALIVRRVVYSRRINKRKEIIRIIKD